MIRHLLAHAVPAVRTAPDVWTTDYRLPLDFPGFTGHFENLHYMLSKSRFHEPEHITP